MPRVKQRGHGAADPTSKQTQRGVLLFLPQCKFISSTFYVQKVDLRFFCLGPTKTKIYHVLEHFVIYFFAEQKLISSPVRLALKRKVFFNPGLSPLTNTIVSLWSLCAWTMDVNLPPWIPPQPTICQRGTKSDVPPIMRAVSGNPAAESPPCRRVPSHTSPNMIDSSA